MTTRVEYTPQLVEEAVFLRMQRTRPANSQCALEWDRDREAAYAQPPGPRRDLAFVALSARAFRQLALDRPIERALRDCPSASRSLTVLYVRGAQRTRDEGAELYTSPAIAGSDAFRTRAILSVKPERFVDAAALERFALLELLVIDDMLDPAFRYRPSLAEDLEPARRELVRERLRESWNARTLRRASGAGVPLDAAAIPQSFRQVFRDEADPARVGERFRRACSDALTYDDLLQLARDAAPARAVTATAPRLGRQSDKDTAAARRAALTP